MQALLVHGMGRTARSMRPLARRLESNDVRVERVGYLAARDRVDEMTTRVADRLRAMTGDGPLVAIGHSFGGLLLRMAVARVRPNGLRSIIMAGTPNRPPRMARWAHRVPPARWLFGETMRCLAEPAFFEALPPPTTPYAVVAGTRGLPVRISPFGSTPNDGVVAVSETVLDDAVPPIEVRASHTWLMNHPAVETAALQALRTDPVRGHDAARQ